MSEAGEATTGGTTLPQAAADAPAAAPPDPAPKSPAASGAPQAPAPAALLAGSPGGDAAPGPAPASSAPAGSEDAEKKVLGESPAAARERRLARMDVDAGRAGTRGPGLGSLGCESRKQHVSPSGEDGAPGRHGRGDLGRFYCVMYFFCSFGPGGSGVCPRRPSLVGLGQPPCSCEPHAGTGMLQRPGKLGGGHPPAPCCAHRCKGPSSTHQLLPITLSRTVGTHVV